MCVWSAPRRELTVHDAASAAQRRALLQFMGALMLGACLPPLQRAQAAGDDAAFAAGSLEDVLNTLGAAAAQESQIALVVPDFVENGAAVPVEVTSHLKGAQEIFIISEANPYPLAAKFAIPEGTDPFVATRIKVARSCNVVALVKADGRFYTAVKATTVTVGGCGA